MLISWRTLFQASLIFVYSNPTCFGVRRELAGKHSRWDYLLTTKTLLTKPQTTLSGVVGFPQVVPTTILHLREGLVGSSCRSFRPFFDTCGKLPQLFLHLSDRDCSCTTFWTCRIVTAVVRLTYLEGLATYLLYVKERANNMTKETR